MLVTVTCAVIFVLLFLYFYGTRNFNYWCKRGIKHDKPIPFFGNALRQLFQKISMSEMITENYFKYKNERCVGFFIGNKPALLLRDPKIIKQVLVADFHYFYLRGILMQKDVAETLLKNLFTVDGDMWKLLRQRMTPAFTTGKLKNMFPLIVERAQRLQEIAIEAAERGKEVDVRELMARYATDFIGACGFGVDTDSLNNENSTFRKLGRRIFTITTRDAFVYVLKTVGSETFKKIPFLAPEIEQDTVGLVKSIMMHRNYKHSGRNDFIDLLLELKEKGKLLGESIESRRHDGTPELVELEMDELLMAAQAFVFFAAGFETSSSSSSHTLHQLAFHPEIQKKCQYEIDEVLTKYDGVLSYEAVKEMKYLEMVFKESMRLLPPLGFFTRQSAKKYTFPGTDITIDEDVLILIPTHGLHNDEKYFENPEKFEPERFHPDNIQKINKFTYIPFGAGPRSCIGERLGLMQSLTGLAAILSRCTVQPSSNSEQKLVIDPSSIVVQLIKGGIPLNLVARKNIPSYVK